MALVQARVKKAVQAGHSLLIAVIVVCLTLSGCWDKVELENRGIVVSIGIDRYDINRRSFLHLVGKEEFNRFTVSAVLPHVTSMRDSALSDKSKAVKKADSPTVSGSIQLMDAGSSQKLYLSNTKLLVLGNDLLMDDTLFRQAIDAVERNRQISRKVYIMSTKERADEVLQQDLPGEPTLGLFMESYYKNSGGTGFFGFYRVLEKIITDLHSTGCTLIPEIEKRSQVERLHRESDHKDRDKKDEKKDDCEGDAAHVEGSEDGDNNNNENTDGMSEEDPHHGDSESNDDNDNEGNDEDEDDEDNEDEDSEDEDSEDDGSEDNEDEDSEDDDSEDNEDEDSEDDDGEDNEDSEDEDSEDNEDEDSEDEDNEDENSEEDSEDNEEDSEDEDSEDDSEDSENEDSEDNEDEDSEDDNNDDSEDAKIRLGGCAVIRDYKLVGWLNDVETRGYAWVAGNCRDAEVHVPFDNKLIGFKVHRSRARIRFHETDGKLECAVRVRVRGVVNECNREFLDLSDPANIENFEVSVEEFIKREIEQTATRLQQELRADVYNLKDLLRKKNHRLFLVYGEEWDKHFSEMEIVPEIKVDVVSTGVIL